MKVAAKDDQVGINAFQLIKPFDMVMQIGKTQNSQRLQFCYLLSFFPSSFLST